MHTSKSVATMYLSSPNEATVCLISGVIDVGENTATPPLRSRTERIDQSNLLSIDKTEILTKCRSCSYLHTAESVKRQRECGYIGC